MLACPRCQSATAVLETRETGDNVRRRRRCVNDACGAKITTFEVIVPDHTFGSDLVVVPRSALQKLVDVANKMLGQYDGEDPSR